MLEDSRKINIGSKESPFEIAPNIISPYLTVYGQGIGEKPANLERYRERIHALGFKTNPQIVLGSSLVNQIRPGSNFDLRKHESQLRPFLERIIRTIPEPFIVRSAAISGDALGVGAYKSVFANRETLVQSTRAVLNSFDSEEARYYRSKAGKKGSDEFSIAFEAVIGNRIEFNGKHYVGPLIAGAGYSSSNIGPYITATAGLGFTLMTNPKDGVRICAKNAASLSELLNNQWLFRNYGSMTCSVELGGRTLRIKREDFSSLDVNFVLEGLKQLQETDVPIYVEYAVTGSESHPECYITQIAEDPVLVDESALSFVRQNPEGGMFNICGDVKGTARFDCDRILFIPHYSRQGQFDLEKLNAENLPYILVIDSAYLHRVRHFPGSSVSNARLIIGVDTRSSHRFNVHQISIATHIQQQLRQSGTISAGIMQNYRQVPCLTEWLNGYSNHSVLISGQFSVGGYETSGDGRLVVISSGGMEFTKLSTVAQS